MQNKKEQKHVKFSDDLDIIRFRIYIHSDKERFYH